MSKLIVFKRALDPLQDIGNPDLNNPLEIAPKPEPDPITEMPHRASAVTPRISDLLARVEGIQRWGLNE